ncbi:MAG: hypothetical protein MUP62_01985, partial [Dehalococcoidia bacterium]|nr:hypothetical protein [Dehalococcoidia bacterium]
MRKEIMQVPVCDVGVCKDRHAIYGKDADHIGRNPQEGMGYAWNVPAEEEPLAKADCAANDRPYSGFPQEWAEQFADEQR